MAKFEAGKPRHPDAGRKPDSVNKKTRALLEILEGEGVCLVKRLLKILDDGQLSPKEEADVLLKLMDFVYPKRKAIEHTGKDGEKLVTIEDFVKNIKE